MYSVDVVWGNLEFTYSANKGTWNPDTLTYSNPVAGVWSVASPGTDNVVTVTNKSNANIRANLTAAINEAYNKVIGASIINGDTLAMPDVGGTFGTSGAGVLDLQSADNTLGEAGARIATYGSFAISLNGTPADAIAAKTVIGTLTITITAPTGN